MGKTKKLLRQGRFWRIMKMSIAVGLSVMMTFGLISGGFCAVGAAAAETESESAEILAQGTLGNEIKRGDINNDGDISEADIVAGLRTISGTYNTNTLATTAGDLNDDGELSVQDVMLLMMTILKLRDDTLGADNLETVSYDDPVPDVYKEGSSFLEEETVGFYSADGYGKYTTGGRGGQVIYVTSLEDDPSDVKEGTLRYAVEKCSGARIIVFRVSGNIKLQGEMTLKNGNVTIAGETAPGDGITLSNFAFSVKCDNVIIRYINFRSADYSQAMGLYTGGEAGVDSLTINGTNIIIDHCEAVWGTDETLSVTSGSDNVTVQWTIIAESLAANSSTSTVKWQLGLASLIAGESTASYTFHHNLYACHRSRIPEVSCSTLYTDDNEGAFEFEFINNVVYCWSSTAAGKTPNSSDLVNSFLTVTYTNFINNYYISENSGGSYMLAEQSVVNRLYAEGNYMDGVIPENQLSLVTFEDDILDLEKNPFNTEEYGYSYLDLDTMQYVGWFTYSYLMESRFEDSEMTMIQDGADAYEEVMTKVGSSLSRDAYDIGLIEGIENGTALTINYPDQSAGWNNGSFTGEKYLSTEYGEWFDANLPEMASYTPYTDTDGDGMSDAWEDAMGLDKNDSTDGAASYLDTEYTYLDVFLQFLTENPAAAIGE